MLVLLIPPCLLHLILFRDNKRSQLNQLLDYAATNPDAVIEYNPSDMILKIHSDASYLSEPRAKSRVGGHYYLGQNDDNMDQCTRQQQF